MAGSLSAATQLSMNAVTRERKMIFNSISQSDAINEAKDWSLYTFHEALNLAAAAQPRRADGRGGEGDGAARHRPAAPAALGRLPPGARALGILARPQEPPARPAALPVAQ